jgi:MscS family membrane protein
MKVRFEAVFKIYVVCLVVLLLWSFWAHAQPSNVVREPSSAQRISTNAANLSFGLDQVSALDQSILGVPLWQYLASIIYIGLAFLVARILDWLIRGKLRRFTSRTQTKLDDILLRLLGGPIKVIAFVILLHVGLTLFPWPDAIERYISYGLRVVVALSLSYVALKAVDVLIDVWRQRASATEDRALSDHLLPFVRNSLKVFLVIVAVLLTGESLGIKMTSLIASLSVGGLALGLAAQDTLGNLFGAIAVLVDKPFRVGDRIRIDQVEGAVEAIGMRSTRVRTADGHLVSIPNKTVGNAVIINITVRPTIRTVLNIGITYDTSADRMQRALAILKEIYEGHSMTKEVTVTFNRFADSALNIEVVHLWNSTDWKAYLAGLQELNLTVKRRFDEERIEFAYPTQTILVKSVEAA